MPSYETIKAQIVFERKIFHRKNIKEFLGCLVKSKYSDGSDNIQLCLFQIKEPKDAHHQFNLINYTRCEKVVEKKKDMIKVPVFPSKMWFDFKLIPKHQESEEIFACDSEQNQNEWLNQLNQYISQQLNQQGIYEPEPTINEDQTYIEPDELVMLDLIKQKTSAPPPVPRRILSKPNLDIAPINTDHYLTLKPCEPRIKKEDIFYEQRVENLQEIFRTKNQSGVYAVSPKTKCLPNCSLALRVYENVNSPLHSWNIYEDEITKKLFLDKKDRMFPDIIELCLYYTKNDLPTTSNGKYRLSSPYKH